MLRNRPGSDLPGSLPALLSSKARAYLGLVFHLNRDFPPDFGRKTPDKKPQNTNLNIFSNFYYVTSLFIIFRLGFDSWLERFFFFGQKGSDSLECQNLRLDPPLFSSNSPKTSICPVNQTEEHTQNRF
jgi:hypothetical protein